MIRSNTRSLVLALTLPLLAGCFDLDLTGLEWGSGYDGPYGGGGWSYLSSIEGSVYVGDWAVMGEEGMALFFAPADSLTPVDSIPLRDGGYSYSFSDGRAWEVCHYLVSVVLWNGTASDPAPMLDRMPESCSNPASWATPTAIRLPPYDPFEASFVVEGSVVVDGRVADAGEATATFELRTPHLGRTPETVQTDADGRYALETDDPAVWFGLCRDPRAQVGGASWSRSTGLTPLSVEECTQKGVTLPDVRVGAIKAAVVEAWKRIPGGVARVGRGEATAEILDADDSTRVGERSASHADGSMHLWLPPEVTKLSCGWLIRVTYDGVAQTRALRNAAGDCWEGMAHSFEFEGEAETATSLLHLTVDDPVQDFTGLTDIDEMTMAIDPVAGDYEIVLRSTDADPFQGEVRININLFNPEASSFFSDTMRELTFADPETEVVLGGSSPDLVGWQAGQEVFTNSLAGTANPPGTTVYRTSVTHLPMGFLDNEDVIAFEDLGQPALLVER